MLKVVQQASELSMMQLYTGHKDNPLPNPQIHISENPNPHPDIQTLLNRFGVVFQDPYTLPPFRPGFTNPPSFETSFFSLGCSTSVYG